MPPLRRLLQRFCKYFFNATRNRQGGIIRCTLFSAKCSEFNFEIYYSNRFFGFAEPYCRSTNAKRAYEDLERKTDKSFVETLLKHYPQQTDEWGINFVNSLPFPRLRFAL
jgi:hypothetical protein